MKAICTVIVLFLIGFIIKMARSLHDMYAVVVIFVVDHKRFALILVGFILILFIQHCVEWAKSGKKAEPVHE